jgi:hypothetical protein
MRKHKEERWVTRKKDERLGREDSTRDVKKEGRKMYKNRSEGGVQPEMKQKQN